MTSINLQNLAAIGQLDSVPFSAELIRRMLASAQQRLRDAEIAQNSAETRFDCAYATLRISADIGLHLCGFRTSTSRPGHHQTAVQCLAHTLQVPVTTVRVLDGLRKQRNLTDYDGDLVTQTALNECLAQARAVLQRAQDAVGLHPALRL